VQFIGRLQTNKVRLVADLVDVWASVDRDSVVDEIAKRVPGARILVQVDTTGDPAKGGCPIDEVAQLVDRAAERGLRTSTAS
jgi:PLP dependent protein